jgi:hypothetical protein
MKRPFFYLLFLVFAGLMLTELVLKIPSLKSFIRRPDHYAPEIPSKSGYVLPEEAVKKVGTMLSSEPSQTMLANIGMDDSTIVNEPMSPLSYTKGKGPDLGEKPIHSVKTEKDSNKIIYDVNYGFDKQRRRATVTQNPLLKSGANIVLLGCSFVFGMGVNDNETMASHMQTEAAGKYAVHNLGIIAGGANDFLDDVTTGNRIADLNSEKRGSAVYVYFSIHRERTFCLADCYRDEWRRRIYLNNSAWAISEDYEVSRTGTIIESRSVIENIFRRMFYSTEIGRLSQTFYSAELPKYKREYIKYLKALRRQWERRNFKFVVYLLDRPDTPWTDEDIGILKESGIDYIYFNRDTLFNRLSSEGVIPGDDHFNSAGNKLRALQIVEGLKQKGYW